MVKVPKVKVLGYLPLLTLDDQTLGCRTQNLPANTRKKKKKEQEGKPTKGIGEKLSVGDHMNSQTKVCFLWVLSSPRKEQTERLIEGCLEIPVVRGQGERDYVGSQMLYRDAWDSWGWMASGGPAVCCQLAEREIPTKNIPLVC